MEATSVACRQHVHFAQVVGHAPSVQPEVSVSEHGSGTRRSSSPLAVKARNSARAISGKRATESCYIPTRPASGPKDLNGIRPSARFLSLLSSDREVVRPVHLDQEDALVGQALVSMRGLARLIPVAARAECLSFLWGLDEESVTNRRTPLVHLNWTRPTGTV